MLSMLMLSMEIRGFEDVSINDSFQLRQVSPTRASGRRRSYKIEMSYKLSQLSRCCTARGSRKGFSRFSPIKVKGHKSFSFTEGFLMFEK